LIEDKDKDTAKVIYNDSVVSSVVIFFVTRIDSCGLGGC
jgi:hypothetical protein